MFCVIPGSPTSYTGADEVNAYFPGAWRTQVYEKDHCTQG